jgi:hypothetical protein
MRRRKDPRLEKFIEEATLAAYGPAEQATGSLTMVEEYVAPPSKARGIGKEVRNELRAMYRRRRRTHSTLLTELKGPVDVGGREWTAACFQFRGERP